jgi:hypothetical protein
MIRLVTKRERVRALRANRCATASSRKLVDSQECLRILLICIAAKVFETRSISEAISEGSVN